MWKRHSVDGSRELSEEIVGQNYLGEIGESWEVWDTANLQVIHRIVALAGTHIQ